MGTKTITLFDRRPVEIDEEQWPVIASASDWEYNSNWEHKIFVREHKNDGRCLVYGIATTEFKGHTGNRGGYLVENLDLVAETIRRLCTRFEFDQRLADMCIAKLPAESI